MTIAFLPLLIKCLARVCAVVVLPEADGPDRQMTVARSCPPPICSTTRRICAL